jgi:hypothetical protein
LALPFSYEGEPEGDGIEHQAYFYSRQVQFQSGNAAMQN